MRPVPRPGRPERPERPDRHDRPDPRDEGKEGSESRDFVGPVSLADIVEAEISAGKHNEKLMFAVIKKSLYDITIVIFLYLFLIMDNSIGDITTKFCLTTFTYLSCQIQSKDY